ncbi:MAG TPA: hypothetical protein VEC57_20845 [Candidatus Limnocylindrales bacterium]|nr:hypothetical protein [Candidatus Limnocylindrales bacterium]
MTYVTITTKQKVTDARAIREYLIDAQSRLPETVPNTQMHCWLERIASMIDEEAARIRKVVQLRPNQPEPPSVA